MIQFGACLFLLAAVLGIGLTGFALALAICLALREVVPEIVVVILSFPIWAVCTAGVAWVVTRALRAAEERRRRAFLQRPVLSEDDFCGHFGPELRPVAASLRQEVAGLIGNAEVSGRLMPADPIRQTSLVGSVEVDDLDWVTWLTKLEARFGASVPQELTRDASGEQLVRALGRRAPAAGAPQPGSDAGGTTGP